MGRKVRYDDYDDDDDWAPAAAAGGGGKKKSNSRKDKSATPPPAKDRSGGGKRGGGGVSPAERSITPTKTRGGASDSTPAAAANTKKHVETGVTKKKQKLTESDRIYHRLMWDDRLNPADFDLGYEDRFKGIMYIPIRKFRNTGDETSEIPFHRVYYFRYKGEVIWDRLKRADSVDALYETQGTATSTIALLANVKDQSKLSIIAPEKKNKKDGDEEKEMGGEEDNEEDAPAKEAEPKRSESPVSNASTATPPPEGARESEEEHVMPTSPSAKLIIDKANDATATCTAAAAAATTAATATSCAKDPLEVHLKLVTFNALFDLFDAEKIHTPQRIPLICQELERQNADVVCLQEMTQSILSGLRNNSKFLREEYYWTSLPTDTKTAQVILSKYPITESVSAAMSKNKRCIYAVLQVNLKPVVVANCHLISDYGGSASGDRRIAELKTIFKALSIHSRTILMGDFNFGDTNPEQTMVNWNDHLDCHLYANNHGKGSSQVGDGIENEGFTFDLEKNPLARISCKHHLYPRRLDRILVRGTCFTPVDCAIFADVPTPVDIPKTLGPSPHDLFPSDHFGVVSNVTLSLSDEESNDNDKADGGGGGGGALGSKHVDPHGHTSLPMTIASQHDFFPFHRSALVVIPPKGLHASIDAFRDGRDKAFPRWMPHISLFYPFVHPTKFSAAIDVIDAALHNSTLKPFKVEVRKAGHFDNRKAVVFLIPETEEREMIGIHQLLQPLFPTCGRQPAADEDDAGFKPHLTLGQVEKGTPLNKFLEEVKESWQPRTFTVSQLHLICHLEDRPGYEIMHSFDLPTTRSGGSSAITSPSGPTTSQRCDGMGIPLTSANFDISEMVMEDPQWGSKMIPPYIPQDPLESWLATNSIRDYAREAPTHISQKGAMYHIPSDRLDEYLERWKESIDQNHDTPFYIEEVRGNPFRLYVDLDIKRTVEVPCDADVVIKAICTFTKEMFPLAEVTCLILQCHGPWKDSKDDKTKFKSGFRLYFQRVFVTAEVYERYMRRLAHWCRTNIDSDAINFLPENTTWEDLIDQHGCAWERGRLLGTIKRRKSLERIYTYHSMFNETGRIVELSNIFKEDIRRVMYGQTLRLWDTLPTTPGVLQENHFLVERLYQQLEGLHQ